MHFSQISVPDKRMVTMDHL